MKLKEMLKKVLALIEELNPESKLLTDDPDIAAKIRDVINQVMFECARMKKIPKLVVLPVTAGQILDYDEIANACGFDIYQVVRVAGVKYELWAGGTVLEILDSGTAKIDVFIYPKPIVEDTNADEYEFILSRDVLEPWELGLEQNTRIYLGDNLIIPLADGARLGVEICEDLWSSTPPSSKISSLGADRIFNLSASNEILGKNNYRKSLIINQRS